MKTNHVVAFGLALLALASCNPESEGDLVFTFHFDEQGERLNNLGEAEPTPEGHAGQNPRFRGISAHYIELMASPYTPVGDGLILYQGAETSLGGASAIDFQEAVVVGQGEEFARVPLKGLTSGEYPYFRISLSYQNFDVDLKAENGETYPTTLASFVGYNTYIDSYALNEETIAVNGNKLQDIGGLKSWEPPWKAKRRKVLPPFPIPFGRRPPFRKAVASSPEHSIAL